MTIKRNGDRVILKNEKVSCSCCGGCCMYSPRFWFQGMLTDQDYPDQITLEYSFPLEPSSYGPVTLTRSVVGDEITYVEGEEPNTFLRAFDNEPNYGWASGGDGGALVGGSCLNYDTEQFLNGQLVYIEKTRDFFASSYSISGPTSGQVSRTNRKSVIETEPDDMGISSKYTVYCGEWLGTNLVLIFNGAIGKWTVNGNAKSGFQNTPVGSYAGGFSVS